MVIKTDKGITLIALVITIIILILLAGVSINMLIGENGIITQAQKAKENTELAQIKEQEGLNELCDILAAEWNYTVIDKTIEQLKVEGTYVKGNTQVKDNRGNKVIIPDGFKIATDSGSNISEGIVIEDNQLSVDGNSVSRGNQFVWIPVGKIIKADDSQITIILGRYSFAESGTETLVQSASNYIEQGSSIVIDSNYKELVESRVSNNSSEIDATNTTAKSLKKFIESVNTNKGYYIARYEASYRDGTKPYSKTSKIATDSKAQVEGKVWNWITQPAAATASKAMYTNINFETDLMNSYAWDTAIVYIQKCSGDNDYARQASLNTIIANTGKNGDERCKIHDMASNMGEWITEYCTKTEGVNAYPATDRGGCYDAASHYTSYRGYSKPTGNLGTTSFRPILYL